MEIITLASSSSSNCCILTICGKTFIIDTGKTDIERIKNELKNRNCEAILITHSHSDHLSKNTFKISQELNAPLYIKKESINEKINKHEKYFSKHPENLTKIFESSVLRFGDVKVTAAELTHKGMGRNKHSAAFSYFFENTQDKKESLYFATDIGSVTPEVQNFINKCDVLFIEANHDTEKVENSGRYYKHKDWTLSENGHISNFETANAVRKGIENRKKPYKKIILAHLSGQCNTPEKAVLTVYDKVKDLGQGKDTIIAAPAKETLKLKI